MHGAEGNLSSEVCAAPTALILGRDCVSRSDDFGWRVARIFFS